MQMSDPLPSWICCQIGAREHYAIPRVLSQAKQLTYLITDAWITPQSALHLFPKSVLTNLRERFHTDLAHSSVHAFTHSLIHFELSQKIQKNSGWQHIIARNHWFQKQTVPFLEKISFQRNHPPTLFAYSYAALDLFRFAKNRGWRTVLGQIDPGPVEEQVVLEEHQQHPIYQSKWQPAPSPYWASWQEECSLADRIVVNSFWSSQALQQAGIPTQKLDIIPLAYQPPAQAQNFERVYPATFSAERPLRVLFLGQVILRKGVAALLEAVELLQGYPIEFWLVGSLGITKPLNAGSLQWIGTVPRSVTAKYYQQADIFLFPTLSDGFGLTQLEAQAWKLPIIASRFCGEVVKDGVNGLILPAVSAEGIANTLLYCLNNPRQLETFSQQSINTDCFSLSQLQHHLQALPYATI